MILDAAREKALWKCAWQIVSAVMTTSASFVASLRGWNREVYSSRCRPTSL